MPQERCISRQSWPKCCSCRVSLAGRYSTTILAINCRTSSMRSSVDLEEIANNANDPPLDQNKRVTAELVPVRNDHVPQTEAFQAEEGTDTLPLFALFSLHSHAVKESEKALGASRQAATGKGSRRSLARRRHPLTPFSLRRLVLSGSPSRRARLKER